MTARIGDEAAEIKESGFSRRRAWAEGHARLLVWLGLAACVLAALPLTLDMTAMSRDAVLTELGRKEDIHNLYYAAASASWHDVPRWWTGSWIYPDVGYYRPLTSMLYLAEYRTFGANFTAWNRVTLVFHLCNIALVYLLTVSLFRRYRIARGLLGAIAAYYFTSTDGSMFFSISKVLGWWPAQNDVMSLTFGLLSLLLLDQYLGKPSRAMLGASLLSLFLSIASKEMGFIVAPIALALVAQRRLLQPGPWRAAILSVTGLTAFMWFYRRAVIPNTWGPVMFRRLIFERMLLTWLGPGALFAHADIAWPAAASILIAFIVAAGLKLRWSVIWIVALSIIAACATVQLLVPDGTFVILMFYPDQERLFSTLGYLLAGVLFVRYARREPALFTGAALWLVYLPILQYGGGKHYYYWPSAINGIADAAFAACLWQWALELKTGANWSFRVPFLSAALERETGVASRNYAMPQAPAQDEPGKS
jgi:hypothetical protein